MRTPSKGGDRSRAVDILIDNEQARIKRADNAPALPDELVVADATPGEIAIAVNKIIRHLKQR